MRIFTNKALIKRNARIGKAASLAGVVILVGGMLLSFREEELIGLAFAALIGGFSLSQIGIFLGNRYARQTRPDQALNTALKGLDRQHTLYHYIAPVAHLLIGPPGIWILMPRHQRGRITFRKNRWRQSGGLGLTYMRFFAQEGLGRPDLEVGAELNAIEKFLKRYLPEMTFPEPQAALLFTDERTDIDAEDAPIPTLPVKKFKEYVRKNPAGKNRLSPEQIAAIQGLLEKEFAGTPAEEE